MSLFDAAQYVINEYKKETARKQWQSYLFAAKLRDLRQRKHLTQIEVASKTNISHSAIRNYEQRKSHPKEQHLEEIAGALGVRPEALHVYDIAISPAHALFQLGEIYGLMPASDPRYAALKPTSPFMKRALRNWANQYRHLKHEEISRDQYENWKDSYSDEYEYADFPERCSGTANQYQLIEPWESVNLSNALHRLRHINQMTQQELSEETGIPKSTIRSYEQRKHLPKISHIALLSEALNVSPGALIFFDFGSPVQALHALFQIANTNALIPDFSESGKAILRTVRPNLEQIIDQWSDEIIAVEKGDPELDYQSWKDVYDPEISYGRMDFNYSYAGRSRYDYVIIDRSESPDNKLNDAVKCSKYDPYDCRYKDGFLRA